MLTDLTILVVDDNRISRSIVAHHFESLGCKVTQVDTGERSILELLNRNYDLIVLDWKMPSLDGRDTLMIGDRILQKRLNDMRVPVIIYSDFDFRLMNFPEVDCLVIRSLVAKSLSQTSQRIRFKQAVDSIRRWKMA